MPYSHVEFAFSNSTENDPENPIKLLTQSKNSARFFYFFKIIVLWFIFQNAQKITPPPLLKDPKFSKGRGVFTSNRTVFIIIYVVFRFNHQNIFKFCLTLPSPSLGTQDAPTQSLIFILAVMFQHHLPLSPCKIQTVISFFIYLPKGIVYFFFPGKDSIATHSLLLV